KETLGIMLTGKHSDWRHSKEEEDFYSLKGRLERTFERIGIDDVNFSSGPQDIFEKGSSAHITHHNRKIGYLGVVSSEILKKWDIKQKNVLFAEIDLDLAIKE